MPDQTSRSRPIAAGQLALELPTSSPHWVSNRVEGPGPSLGPQPPPMCSYLAELPRVAGTCLHPRYSRPGDVSWTRSAAVARLRSRRSPRDGSGWQRPQSPRAVLTAAKLEPATPAEADPPHGPPSRLGHRRPGLLPWTAGGDHPVHPSALALTAGSGRGPDARTEPVPDEVALAFHPGTLARSSCFARTCRGDDRTDRFISVPWPGSCTARPRPPCRHHANTFSMAPRYVCDYVTRTGYEPPSRDAFNDLPAKLDRLYRQPLPTSAGNDSRRCPNGGATRPRALSRPRPAGPGKASGHLPAYLRVLKYGFYNSLRTWLLGFDAAAIDAELDAAHRREPYLVSCARSSPISARPSPMTGSRSWSSATWRWTVATVGRGHRPRGAGLGGGRTARGLPIGRSRPRRGCGKPQDDPPVGRQAGQGETKSGRILVLGAGEAGRRRALATADLPIDWEWPPTRLRAL